MAQEQVVRRGRNGAGRQAASAVGAAPAAVEVTPEAQATPAAQAARKVRAARTGKTHHRRSAPAEMGVDRVRRRVAHAGGWYELKYVGDCGPYLYYRWQDGGVRRSEYVGKADAAALRWVQAHKRRRGRAGKR